MAKSLGQIHTVNYPNIRIDATAVGTTGRLLFDLPGQLTKQLQHMVRMMQSFKLVGIDVTAEDYSPAAAGGSWGYADGNFRFFVPTRGRCKALQHAYHTVRKALRLKGVDTSKNINYDFRPILTNPANYQSAIAPVWPEPSPTADGFKNAAYIEEVGNVPQQLSIVDPTGSSHAIFPTWNAGIEPRMQAGTPDFSAGYNLFGELGDLNRDYVMNEDEYLESLDDFADVTMEEIPFAIGWGVPDTTAVTGLTSGDFQWRPDPALYMAILCGQLECRLDNVKTDDTNQEIQLNFAFHVAGWKSILGSGKKHRRSKKGGKKHGKKRHSKR